MVRRTTHLALVVFALVVATGPSALALADADGLEAATPAGATDDFSDGGAADGNLTDETTTDDEDGNLTEENIADDTVENETVDDETTDATGTVTNETSTTDGDATTEAAAADATTSIDETDTDGTDTREPATDEASADVIQTVGDATGGATGTNPRDVPLDATASSSPSTDAVGVEDPSLGDGDDAASHDEGSASSSRDDSDSSTEQERRTENETTTPAGTDDGVGTGGDAGGGDAGSGGAGSGDAGGGDAKSPASEADSEGSPDADSSGAPPGGTEVVAGVGALAAVALFPHVADGLSVASDAGALSSASSTAASSRSLVPLQGDFDKVWRTATAFRYSRYDDSDPLAHETRATLHETVERSPGVYLSEVCERADVAVSTARHHLDVLEDEGLVTTVKVRGKRRYFPGRGDDVELAAALEDEEAAAVLRALARLGDSHGGRVADELDRDPSTVSHHLSRLEDAGLVEREREGRAVVNRLAPEVARVLGEGRDEGDDEIEADREVDAEASAIAD